MRKVNLILVLVLVGVLLAPGVAVAKMADACCGVNVADLVVSDAPDPACIDDTVTINGTYNAFSDWGPWTELYDTGIEIRIYDSSMTMVDSYMETLGDQMPDPGDYPGTSWPFSYDWATSTPDTYTYEVIAWSQTGYGRMEVSVVGETITVEICNEAPDCSEAYPSMDIIWPPNHKFVDINILGVTDPDGDPVTITINRIMQDEPVQTHGDGNFEPDGQGVGTDTASLRAERSGTKKVPGDGRVYHIYFTAEDGRGGVCRGEVQVGVPHDVKDIPVDGGAIYVSGG